MLAEGSSGEDGGSEGEGGKDGGGEGGGVEGRGGVDGEGEGGGVEGGGGVDGDGEGEGGEDGGGEGGSGHARIKHPRTPCTTQRSKTAITGSARLDRMLDWVEWVGRMCQQRPLFPAWAAGAQVRRTRVAIAGDGARRSA